jgi:hypothetical protein
MVLTGYAYADEPADGGEDSATEEGYSFPSLKPEVSVSAGFRYVNLRDSERAEEYEYLHNSFMFGTEMRFFSFPHRFHLNIEAKNEKDYFGDINYAFKDIVLFRSIHRGLFHNLDNIRLIDLNPSTPSPGVDVRDSGIRYGTRNSNNNVFLRLKTPDFPFHVYFEGGYYVKDGLQQQRSLLNGRAFNEFVRVSETRNVDWKTRSATLGVNSHLGPVEVDLSHSEKRFDVGGTNVLYDTYTAIPPVRPAGEYPHNLIPELKGSSNTIKLHTSYTGSIVASATLTKLNRENMDSGAKSDYLIGSGEIVWTASPKLVFLLKYRHKEINIDNPESVTVTNSLNPAIRYTYMVGPSVSSITDSVSAIAKLRPVSGLSLRAEYNYEDVRRSHAETIKISDSTQKHVASLVSDIRLAKGLFIKAKYAHKEIVDPAYNIDPDRSDEGSVSVSWIPLPVVSANISYVKSREQRSNLQFLEVDESVSRGGKRDVNRDKLISNLTVLVLKDVSLTGSFAYMLNKVQQDIVYNDAGFIGWVDPFVPYKDKVHIYSLRMAYTPTASMTLSGGISHTVSSGAFYPTAQDLLQPASIASFTQMKTRETTVSANGEYRFKGGFSAGVQYRFSDFRDVLDNPNDDITSGRAHIVLLTISKKW